MKDYKKTCTFLHSMIGICTVLLIYYYTRTFTVTFDTRGAMPYEAKEIRPNKSVPKPADPVMEGYIFEGWYKDAEYSTAWNFDRNRAGLTNYWREGLKRNGKFDNIITMGMRGERDSELFGATATLKDNIDLLRDVLQTQNKLIHIGKPIEFNEGEFFNELEELAKESKGELSNEEIKEWVKKLVPTYTPSVSE